MELRSDFGAWWTAARQIALLELQKSSGQQQAWSLGTLAELTLLGVVYGGRDFDVWRAGQEIVAYCERLREVAGLDRFPVLSTKRQFKRYVDFWPRAEWNELAKAAIAALEA
jgi:hypothetical protein